ncbi:hypothetical protein YC2023_065324 [Brassica napus]
MEQLKVPHVCLSFLSFHPVNKLVPRFERLIAVVVVFFAPFLAPSLVVASTIVFISSLPYFFFLASFVCTEKLMRKLLPNYAFGGRGRGDCCNCFTLESD